jgi:TPP-dependent pyruvate/acetoin dehydrogenase alpha subunit
MPATEIDTELLLELYERMCRIRFFEDRITELRVSGDVVGSVHLCSGQEAICVATAHALNLTKDLVFPTYRGHGWTLACGAPPEAIFAELLGRETGVNSGRGGSAYLFAPDYGLYGENSIVGAGTVIAAGAALAATFDGSGRVAVSVIGDGALNQGSVHEALNFSSIRNLPVLFVVENNGWSELTPIASMTRQDKLYKRASAYGIPSARIDGNDVLNVLATMREVIGRLRSGEGPVFIEAKTDRIVGHSIGDAQQYRAPGELDRIRANEPLVRTRRQLTDAGMPAHVIDEATERAHADILAASERALAAPRSDTSRVLEHLYG